MTRSSKKQKDRNKEKTNEEILYRQNANMKPKTRDKIKADLLSDKKDK